MYLVINLAVADMLVGGCSEIRIFVEWGDLCSLWNTQDLIFEDDFVQHFFLISSLTNLAAISLERAHATFRPFRHRIIKKWVFGFVITIIWVTSGISPIAISYLISYVANFFYVVGSLFGFCLFVICVSYVSIVVKISCRAHPQHHGAASRERKLTKTLLIVTVVSLLMWLPITMFSLFLVSFGSFLPWTVFIRVLSALSILCFANSLVNPILYAIRMPDFKRALVSLFRRQQRQVEIVPLGPLRLPRGFAAPYFFFLKYFYLFIYLLFYRLTKFLTFSGVTTHFIISSPI